MVLTNKSVVRFLLSLVVAQTVLVPVIVRACGGHGAELGPVGIPAIEEGFHDDRIPADADGLGYYEYDNTVPQLVVDYPGSVIARGQGYVQPPAEEGVVYGSLVGLAAPQLPVAESIVAIYDRDERLEIVREFVATDGEYWVLVRSEQTDARGWVPLSNVLQSAE